ncbi:VWA domain-containing protein [Photobacterium sp. TLY01]|uniref:vWA domain-containing protein n=1 Tax=Photobacterium sp. TLY01 TaxID=2907534 RepID=UPI001F2CC5F3|nr:VWA domain-containing protein [Photobacterium sp. TLY01]UIP27071.1 VWA domain-containing protein [Photobacterium sp. TLY01]
MMDMSDLTLLLTQFRFIRPEWLLLLLPFGYLFYVQWKSQEAGSQWQKNLPEHLRKALTVGGSGWRRQLPLLILLLTSALVILVCAGPTWKKQPSPFHEDRTPLIVLMDTSQAMLEKDVAPDRLTRAKQKVEDLLAIRAGGENALIAYAATAHIAMPLTRDIAVFKPMLEALSPEIMPKEGKNAASAISQIQQQLQRRDIPGIVLLITNDVSAQSISQFHDYFSQHKHQLLVLAAGDNTRTSDLPLNMNHLNALVDMSNADLHALTVDNTDVEWIKRKVENHAALNASTHQPWQDMGYYLLFPVALLLLLWFRRGWLVQWSVAALAIFTLLAVPESAYAESVHQVNPASEKSEAPEPDVGERLKQFWLDLWLTPDQQGQWYFRRGDYLEAAEHFADPLWKGVAYYYASQFNAAHTVFMQSSEEVMQFNAANALAHQREYVAARKLLRELVKTYPDNAAMQHNLQVIEGIIEEINQFSESQSGGENANEGSVELGDEPQTADGADEQTNTQVMIQDKLTAEQLLGDEAIANKWLERVEADPKMFLRSKFSIQYQQAQEQ